MFSNLCESGNEISYAARVLFPFISATAFLFSPFPTTSFNPNKGLSTRILLFMEIDPIMKPLKKHPWFDQVMKQIKDRFWENKEELEKSLERKGLL
ncbi:hypothetical protein QU605_14520 [Robiginitalea sp. M39]|uniref:Uncharacterized protein n=1 Tax=Robiginitalea aurantiaca TaxID=3056915 RepID=A0ABT7WID8_9FLAO|nr:hypothetical protein [Robiginitalea aurantiaca]